MVGDYCWMRIIEELLWRFQSVIGLNVDGDFVLLVMNKGEWRAPTWESVWNSGDKFCCIPGFVIIFWSVLELWNTSIEHVSFMVLRVKSLLVWQSFFQLVNLYFLWLEIIPKVESHNNCRLKYQLVIRCYSEGFFVLALINKVMNKREWRGLWFYQVWKFIIGKINSLSISLLSALSLIMWQLLLFELTTNNLMVKNVKGIANRMSASWHCNTSCLNEIVGAIALKSNWKE